MPNCMDILNVRSNIKNVIPDIGHYRLTDYLSFERDVAVVLVRQYDLRLLGGTLVTQFVAVG